MVVQLKNLFLSFVHYKILAEQYFQSTVFCVIKINFPCPYIQINYKKNIEIKKKNSTQSNP